MKGVKEKCSKEALLLGGLVLLLICSVFGWILFLVSATPGQYYPGETDCDVQSSAQLDGNQTLLYCPNTKFISNLTLYDLNINNLGHIFAFFYSSKPLFFPQRFIFQYSFDWWYDVRVGNETYYWSFLLNENSTLILNATLQYPIHLEVYFNYRQIESKYFGSDNSTAVVNYQFESKEDGRYFFYFENERGNRKNNGQVSFTTYETQYDPTSIPATYFNVCVPFGNPPPCSMQFDWNHRNDSNNSSSPCVLVVSDLQRNPTQPNCVHFSTIGRPREWAAISFGGLLGSIVLILTSMCLLSRYSNKKHRRPTDQRHQHKERILSTESENLLQ